MQQTLNFTFDKFNSINELTPEDQTLLLQAREATQLAYAPYSKFLVGSAAKLYNEEIIRGSNQENASFTVTICAERALLATISTLHPKQPIKTLAVSYNNLNGKSNKPISPCGVCRQALLEHELVTKSPIRIIMSGLDGEVFIIASANDLLPFAFTSDDLAINRINAD